jgi:hypothetical protein
MSYTEIFLTGLNPHYPPSELSIWTECVEPRKKGLSLTDASPVNRKLLANVQNPHFRVTLVLNRTHVLAK